jgi:hypothetical protein
MHNSSWTILWCVGTDCGGTGWAAAGGDVSGREGSCKHTSSRGVSCSHTKQATATAAAASTGPAGSTQCRHCTGSGPSAAAGTAAACSCRRCRTGCRGSSGVQTDARVPGCMGAGGLAQGRRLATSGSTNTIWTSAAYQVSCIIRKVMMYDVSSHEQESNTGPLWYFRPGCQCLRDLWRNRQGNMRVGR